MENTARRRSPRISEPAPAARRVYRWAAAVRHLRRVDPHLRTIIDRVGPCRLEPKLDRFGTLVRAIIGQQISSKAAASIHRRLVEIAGEPHLPEKLIELGEPALAGVGLSGVKARYVLNLAEAVASGAVPLEAMDELVVRRRDHQGARVDQGDRRLDGRDVPHLRPEPARCPARRRPRSAGRPARAPWPGRAAQAQRVPALAETWRPYRSVASWYLWRGIETPKPAVIAAVEAVEPNTSPKPRRSR